MNSIIKNISKILALTVFSTNFSTVFSTKPKPTATVQTSTGALTRDQSAALIKNLKGSTHECELCGVKFHDLNQRWQDYIILDRSLLNGTSAKVVLRLLNELDSLFATFNRFAVASLLHFHRMQTSLKITSFSASSPSTLGAGHIPMASTNLPLSTMAFGGLAADHSRDYIAQRDEHQLSHFDDNRAIESTVSHEFAHAMLILHAEQATNDRLLTGDPAAALRLILSPLEVFDAETANTLHAASKCLWDRLTVKIPALADPKSQLNIDLGEYRFQAADKFYEESLAELFAYARTSSRATEEVKQAVSDEFNALFPKISDYHVIKDGC